MAALAVVFAACGNGVAPSTTQPRPPPTAPEVETLRANLARITNPNVTDEELAALVAGNTAFAWDLFHLARSEDENVFFSPYSIASALTMALAGAKGDTASEMRDLLHLELSDDRVHAIRNGLDILIATSPDTFGDDDREPLTIQVANSLWGQAGYPFLDEFLNLLAANYDAGMNLVDYMAAAEEARQTINTWVESMTEGRIVDLIPEGAVNGMTRLVLVNAIWFKGNWVNEFDLDRTTDAPFTLLDGTVIQVPLMRGGGNFLYGSGEGYQSVSIPYAGDAAMVVILPDDGRFNEVAARLDPKEIARLHNSRGLRRVDLTFPKFEFRSNLGLNPILQSLGMTKAFESPGPENGADFTGITAVKELFIAEVIHQAFVKVDEEGTEAAAATAIMIEATSAGPEPATVVIDRPFLFYIEHTSTGEILFMGQVVDPR